MAARRARGRAQPVYALYAEASLYFAADRPPAFKYLWFLGEQRIPHALTDLRDVLAGPKAPRYIVVYQAPRSMPGRRRRGHSRGAARALPPRDAGRRPRRARAALKPPRTAATPARGLARTGRPCRYAAPVEQRTLGSSGIAVSAIGLGCMGMSWAYGAGDDAESIAVIHRALELGVTFLDTSDVYGPFTNEQLVGRALAGRRDELVIATKAGLVVEDSRELRARPRRPARAHPRGLRGLAAATRRRRDRPLLPAPRRPRRAGRGQLRRDGRARRRGQGARARALRGRRADPRARGGDPPDRRAAVGALALDARRARRRAAVVHRARRRVRARSRRSAAAS